MFRIFTSRREFVSALATLLTALRFLSCVLLVAGAALCLAVYVFGIPRAVDAERVMLMGIPTLGAVMLCSALRTRLLKQPCSTKYGTIGPLEPGWAAFVNANILGGVVFFAFGVAVNLLSNK